ncbi:hypothetical protein ACJIZ3_021432 [Penstemon smallii]|uniref:Uncharacterized protein n=1 Tax=Penstemon smallii TaxID=265156 RepID=A0ABD3SME2_9LAMI
MNNSESKNQLKVEIKCKAINVRQKIDHIIRHEVVSKSLKHRPTLGDHKGVLEIIAGLWLGHHGCGSTLVFGRVVIFSYRVMFFFHSCSNLA